MKLKIIALICTVFSFYNSFAQELKIGYTNADYILSVMPESRTVESTLKAYESQLQKQLKDKYTSFQDKAAKYQQGASSMPEAERTKTENELQSLQQEIQKFESEAQNNLVKKRNDLISPLYSKIGSAIEAVAKENGYTHILSSGSSSTNVVLYAREQDNVSNLILAKLGIDPSSIGGNK